MKMKGRQGLRKRIEIIPSRVIRAARGALEKAADDVVATQKRFAPEKDGTLRDSIRRGNFANYGGNLGIAIEAGGPTTTRPVRNGADASYDYALGVEFGTREMTAQPFFYTGYRSRKRAARARVKRAVRKAIKDS